MTDEQTDRPDAERQHPFLPPTLPLPTEPLAAFGVRATAEVPEPAPPPLPRRAPAVEPPPGPPVPAPPTVRLRPLDPPGTEPAPLPRRPGPAVGSAPPMPPVTAAAAPPPPLMPPVTAAAAPPLMPPTVAAMPPTHLMPPPTTPMPPSPPAPPRLRLPAGSAQPPAHPGIAGPVLVQLGEVAVTATTIITPTGEIPLRGSQWTINDQFHSRQRIPGWAVACAILLFFVLCFLSLLFLLVKTTTYEGSVQISIANEGRHYVLRIPVNDQRVVAHLHAQVNYVRSLAAL
ncbi:hypothetical protein [Catellatospora sp. TT07R-123]|uniref:hypothetical protein n=1 Tax=Catellatospora sp. TT07R-123 TaxID=2733863 RepID=UPI001FD0B7ED|nr:hypothetical protein [Catellatospora sp. TT07R-123]